MQMRDDKVKTSNRSKFSISTVNSIYGYIFIMPWILGFLIFTAYPFFYSIFLSFSSVLVSTEGIQTTWIGLTNYVELFTKDIKFPIALISSIVAIVLSTPMIIVASLIIAMLLNGKYRGRGFFRALYFIPVIIISGPVMSELIENQAAKIVIPTKYMIYQFFSMIGPVGAPIVYVFDNLVLILWFSGVQILIFLAGIQKVDTSIYEAAAIDGASSWQVFWKVVMPYIRPIALINAIFTIVEMSSNAGGDINTGITDSMFQLGHVYSYAAAMSWIYFLIILLLLVITFLILREKKGDR